MSGSIVKRASALVTLVVLSIVGFAGMASATTRPGSEAVSYIQHHDMGHRYVYGATGPSSFDCSGLVQSAFAKSSGRYLPRTTNDQWSYLKSRGKTVSRHQTSSSHQVQYGDILFFWSGGSIIHEGIYIGNGNMIDANSTRGYVKVDSAFYNWGFNYITYGWVS